MGDDSPALLPTPRYEKIIRMAEEQARERGHRYVGVEHLMLAILVEGDSLPTGVLRGMGELTSVRDAIERTMASRSYGPPSGSA
jgi:ATP-dependent Clp protease ATP-binding subunit ClpC